MHLRGAESLHLAQRGSTYTLTCSRANACQSPLEGCKICYCLSEEIQLSEKSTQLTQNVLVWCESKGLRSAFVCQQALRHTPCAVRCGGKASLLRSSLVIIALTGSAVYLSCPEVTAWSCSALPVCWGSPCKGTLCALQPPQAAAALLRSSSASSQYQSIRGVPNSA